MTIQLLLTIMIFTPLLFISTVGYVKLLLAIANKTKGMTKFATSIALYFLYSIVLTSPLFFLLEKHQIEIQESDFSLLMVLISFAVIISPAIFYIGKVKMKQLQKSGYFL